MSAEQNDSGRPSEVHTPLRKEKKRVGFHAGERESSGNQKDDFGHDEGILSPSASPRLVPGRTPPGAPDAVELSIALTKILTAEHERIEDQHIIQDRISPAPATPDTGGPKRPRPALRRNTSYNAPEEQEKADLADSQASARQRISMSVALQRANRLALSVNSAPASRRNSGDLQVPVFQPLIHDTDDDETDVPLKPTMIDNGPSQGLRQRIPRVNSDTWEDHTIAENLVKSHMKKGKKDLFVQKTHGSTSGTATPIPQQDYAHDYVPRPDKYRGGILSSLLKLYNEDRPGASSSGYNTPVTPGTPHLSPRPSPPTSRPGSSVGTPRSRSRTRPGSGLFNHHKSRHSTSSLALTELMKSSSMFAAPGSTEISDHWAEKLKRDKTPPPKKRDQIRITVHIAGIISRHKYLLKLCRALMLYGAPTHRLEEYMTMSSRVLEIEGQFLYIPGCMIISFDDSTTHTTEVKLVRVLQGIDLGRLRDVHNIYKDVVHDKLGADEATKRLDEVMSAKNKFSTWFRVFLYGVASVCVAPFAFQGRFIDLPVAFLLGCIVGVLQLVCAPSNELYANVFEVSAAVITSFLARGFGSINGGELFCFSALAQSSIALILPGYMVLCSSLELQSYNIVSGSVRMVHAMVYTLFLGYGITIGTSLYGMIDSNATSSTTCSEPLNRNWYFLFVPAFTLCLCLINQAKWKQTPVMIIMALAGFCVNSYCSAYFGGNGQISNMLGALAVGILANLYSRLGSHVQNAWFDLVDWWHLRVRPRLFRRKRDAWSLPSLSDPESRPALSEMPQQQPRKVGYSLAAAAMLPAIFVQVPSGLAAGGSLLAGINSANELTGNSTASAAASNLGTLDGTSFNVLFKVIQVAIGISVGLFMSALIVYPLGKRRTKRLGLRSIAILELEIFRLYHMTLYFVDLELFCLPVQTNLLNTSLCSHNMRLQTPHPLFTHQGLSPATKKMKIRATRISASIVRAVLRRCSKASLLQMILSFFAFFKLLLSPYRSDDFSALRRDVWELDENEYAASFKASSDEDEATPLLASGNNGKGKERGAILEPAGDLGYSGSTFFTTPNAKFLIKSLPRRFEHRFFARELLDPYIAHMRHQPHSLLVRITDLVHAPHPSLGAILGTAPTHHIVMENLLYGKDLQETEHARERWETYDLKPSDYFFPERDIADGRLAPQSVKDRLIDEFPGKISVSAAQKKELMSLVAADSQLLADANAVDYSLFLVRYPGPNSIPAPSSTVPLVKSNAGVWRSGVDDTEGRWTYRAVVLDFFWAKHSLHARSMTRLVKAFNKFAHKGPMTITADPAEYRERFLDMIDEMVVAI
ncbi:hypothetical protein B0J13DRAFT_439525 [Dactylonectria estremocensis]|uniref:PIPK domain-containing protein n=1 Tax=Dactylonectria estremocensis TaxID=1079267 RepID=A0A9P9F347_9HYPO|nr:hypothetical protein B0J13DRAFT_439525 [Dactylonectria estremocensis]